MTVDAAIARMTEVADLATERLSALGYTATVELDFMNGMLRTVEDKSRAKFITATVVITSPDTPKGDEYCLSLGTEIRGGKVDGDQLERDIVEYGKMVDGSVERLSKFESKAEGVSALAEEASKEYEALVERLNADQKKQRVISTVGMLLVLVGVILLFVVATLS